MDADGNAMPDLPPLAALFLTHFDDLKGQTTIYYQSVPDLPANLIEHATLPSGLHTLKSDLVLFTHGPADLPGVGLFRSVEVQNSGRGRRMGTLGVVLAEGTVSDLFALRPTLESLYDEIAAEGRNPFVAEETKVILDRIWTRYKAGSVRRAEEVGGIRDIVQGRSQVSPTHPISFFPALLVILNPLIITVYKYALAGRRILIYSPPPLLPLGAFAWCIQAMSLPPSAAPDADVSRWLGNVGLMDLDNVKKRKGGWIGATSDAIYRTHTTAYDLFIDLSTPSTSAPNSRGRSTDPSDIGHDHQGHATLYIPLSTPGETTTITYSFPDIPLYRSLLLLQLSPSSVTVSSKLGVRGNVWLWAFEVFERAWKLCRGVCEYALGQGQVGEVHLDEGEEDARLIDVDNSAADEDEEDNDDVNSQEDEAIRVGRLLLRQFHHNTYHLHNRLKAVRRGTGGPLTEMELRELVGRSWRLSGIGSTVEAKWWNDLGRTWGIVVDDE